MAVEEKTTTDLDGFTSEVEPKVPEPKAPEPTAPSVISAGDKVNAVDLNALFERLETIRQEQFSRNDVTNTIISSAFTTTPATVGSKPTPSILTQAQTYINNLEVAVPNIGTTDFSAKITIPTAGQLLNASTYAGVESVIQTVDGICVNCSDFTAHFTSAASRSNFSANFTAHFTSAANRSNFTAHFTSAANRSNFSNFTSSASRGNFSNFTSNASRGNFSDCSNFTSSSSRGNFSSNFSTNANNGNFTGSQSAGFTVFRSSGGWIQS